MLSSLWSLAAAASFSLMAAIVKLSSGEFGSLELVFYRSVFGMVLMIFLAASQHGSMRTEHFRGLGCCPWRSGSSRYAI